MIIELRGGGMDGEQRDHPLHPQLFGECIEGQVHVWRRQDPQAWAQPGRTIPVYDYVGILATY
jgi:hypothetical protein